MHPVNRDRVMSAHSFVFWFQYTPCWDWMLLVTNVLTIELIINNNPMAQQTIPKWSGPTKRHVFLSVDRRKLSSSHLEVTCGQNIASSSRCWLCIPELLLTFLTRGWDRSHKLVLVENFSPPGIERVPHLVLRVQSSTPWTSRLQHRIVKAVRLEPRGYSIV